ncbi:MAG: cytochrome P450 [Chloroflexi bacterium]|nr:MAG: cytochrome P450 [Chloroflexota bacterium]
MATYIPANTLTGKVFHIIKGRPIVGNLPEFNKDRLGLLQRMASISDVCGLHFGPLPGILFNRPEYVHSILVEHAYDFDKGRAIHAVFRPALGDGIFSSEGDFHRRQRKLMAPSFQPRHIASYADAMVHYGEQIQQTWPDGGVIDVNQQMTNLTMSIIGKVLFDADVFTETDELAAAMAVTIEYASHGLSSLFTLPYSWPLPRHLRARKAGQILRNHIQGFIDERRKQPSERNDFLSILLQAEDEDGKPMSDEQLMAECLTLFGAGHETTATALSWTWYLLCQHPEIYQKVQQEVDSILQGRTPTYADLAQLPYCLQVFKEALRLYPPAYAMSRRALRDVEIDGYRVPKDGVALIAPYTLQRREEYFPEPETFNPERFTPEREKQLPRYAYMPFGAGPRICIGLHFAMMEGHLLLATLTQRSSFSLVPGQSIVPDPVHHLAMRPASKVNVVVKKR